MGEPRTEAGRDMLHSLAEYQGRNAELAAVPIAAIEAQARAELLAELRTKVEALPEILEVALGYSVVARAAVLALLSPDTGAPE